MVIRHKYLQFSLISIMVLIINGSVCAFEKRSDGIVVPVDDGLLFIQVCAKDVVRVAFAKDCRFLDTPSLAVENRPTLHKGWNLQSTEQDAIIITDALQVRINLKTGRVSFFDADGKIILTELANGRKMEPAIVQGDKTFHICQQWEPQDESLYGLGQHQLGLMDIKDYDLQLWQHNGTVIVPFLVSSKGYGIFWDNMSYSKFGDVREFEPIPAKQLYDTKEKQGGVTVTYFSDGEFEKDIFCGVSREIGIQLPKMGARPNNLIHPGLPPYGAVSILWEGEIELIASGYYLFESFSDNGVKIWIDGKLIIQDWWQAWLPYANTAKVFLDANRRYKIRVEWVRNQNGNYMSLLWKTPSDNKATSLWSEVGERIDYYFVYGPQIDKVIAGYRKITGKAPMLPVWAYGFWQSRQRYKTADDSLEVLEGFRSRKIPIDNIVQDWFYWKEDGWGSHQFDPQRFPDVKKWIDAIHDKYNARLMISVWGKFYTTTENFEEMNFKGFLYQPPLWEELQDWMKHQFTVYDAFNSRARKLFWSQIWRQSYAAKIDSWWMDATEPELASAPEIQQQKMRMNPTALGVSTRVLNGYSLMNSKGIYEGQRSSAPKRRVCILTRSAFAGQQRYAAATWSGDVPSTWEAMRKQITAGLGFSISGIPYWSMDIGGFTWPPRFAPDKSMTPEAQEEWRELNARWIQFGTFVPMMRSHGEGQLREMFNIAPENHPAYQAMLAYDKLRYRLLPYIYSLAGIVTQDDYTIMRPLVMDFREDKNVLNIGDEFMFGPALLICPVTEYKARSRKVYLPAGGGWYELKTGRYFNGGQTIDANAPYSDIPIFVKEGSIIPYGPDIQYTTEKPMQAIRLFVYAGKNGQFNIYEDEGINYNYEKGAYSIIPLKYDETSKTLTIGNRKGKFSSMLKERTFEIIRVSRDNCVGLDFERAADQTVKYNGKGLIVR
ncbi:MAG: TIM-barrel domain-containing protein [Sedimentisphaerales bacterium]